MRCIRVHAPQVGDESVALVLWMSDMKEGEPQISGTGRKGRAFLSEVRDVLKNGAIPQPEALLLVEYLSKHLDGSVRKVGGVKSGSKEDLGDVRRSLYLATC
jgi:hypothetical protein